MGGDMEGEPIEEAVRLGSVFEKGRFRHGKAAEMLDGRGALVDDAGVSAYGGEKDRPSVSDSTLVLGTCNTPLVIEGAISVWFLLTVMRSSSSACFCSEALPSAPSSSSSTMT